MWYTKFIDGRDVRTARPSGKEIIMGSFSWIRADICTKRANLTRGEERSDGWIVRHVDNLGETLEYFMEYPGDGSLKGSFGPIFGYGTFTFYQIKDMLQDSTPVNKPIPCKMTIERLKYLSALSALSAGPKNN